MKRLLLLLAATTGAFAQPRVAALPDKNPIVTFRIIFTTGAVQDPPDKPGLANLTSQMLANSGTRSMTYKQILDAMYPMATSVGAYSDKEMMTFTAETHIDNLDKFYSIFRAMLLDPGWRADDFARVKDDAINFLKVNLRGNNDEELAKEELYDLIYAGQPYGHTNYGTISALEKMTVEDLKQFYKQRLTQANLIVGLAGGYSLEFLARVKKDFAALPQGERSQFAAPSPAPVEHTRAIIVQKDTRSVAYSIGFPLDINRADPDYPALLVMQSYLGQHRTNNRLYDRMRELRGLNYGDYAYIEYFPRGMFQFDPDPNLARHSQIFQIWIRPVEPPTSVFALRLALYEFDRLLNKGISREDFERTRSFLTKYVNVLTKTKSAELGYAIDSLYYGIPNYNSYVKTALAKLTADDVNRAIKKHMHTDRLTIVAVARDAEALRDKLLSTDASPMTYNSTKAAEVLEEDKMVERWPLGLRAEDIRIVPVDKVFE